jgi:hypothetical protein
MKLYLDDERDCPQGWSLVKTAADAIYMLDSIPVEEISLDHDLGDTEHDPEWTGYTVLLHIESKVVWEEDYHAPVIKIHTANPGARPKMEAGVASIERYMELKHEVEEE